MDIETAKWLQKIFGPPGNPYNYSNTDREMFELAVRILWGSNPTMEDYNMAGGSSWTGSEWEFEQTKKAMMKKYGVKYERLEESDGHA